MGSNNRSEEEGVNRMLPSEIWEVGWIFTK